MGFDCYCIESIDPLEISHVNDTLMSDSLILPNDSLFSCSIFLNSVISFRWTDIAYILIYSRIFHAFIINNCPLSDLRNSFQFLLC